MAGTRKKVSTMYVVDIFMQMWANIYEGRLESLQPFLIHSITALAILKAAEIKQLVEKVAPFCEHSMKLFLSNCTLIVIQKNVRTNM